MIFLSYRHEDAAITRAMQLAFEARGAGHLLVRDVDAFRAGEDLRDTIPSNLQKVDSVLVVIGRNWMRSDTAQDSHDRSSADQDWVRYEVSLALAWGKTILPILVDEAQMPTRSALPGDMADLADKIALPLRNTDWANDLDSIFHQLGLAIPSSEDGSESGPTVTGAGPVAGRDVVIRGHNVAGRDLTVGDS